MNIFIGKNTEDVMDTAMDPDMLMKVAPEYYGPRFDAIADLRKADDGSGHKGQEFRRVASFVNVPMSQVVNRLFDPDFMKDKRKFYAFLDRNLQYCTYDRRAGGALTAKQKAKIPLSALGIDYPAAMEDFEPVLEEIPVVQPVEAPIPVVEPVATPIPAEPA